ncbi:hypothetical protein ACWATR_00815 [Nostoc sp. UIC 10890]
MSNKTLVETAIHRVFKDKLSTSVTLTQAYWVEGANHLEIRSLVPMNNMGTREY